MIFQILNVVFVWDISNADYMEIYLITTKYRFRSVSILLIFGRIITFRDYKKIVIDWVGES